MQEPTHFTEHSSSLIDLFLISNVSSCVLSKVLDPFLEQNIRFHFPIAASFNVVVPKARSFTRRIYKYDACNYNTLRNSIQSTDWQNRFDPNIDIFIQTFTDTLSSLINKYVPSKLVRINPSDKPLVNRDIKQLIRTETQQS